MKYIAETSNATIHLTQKGTILKTFKDGDQDIALEAKICGLAGELLVGPELIAHSLAPNAQLEMEYLEGFNPLFKSNPNLASPIANLFHNEQSGFSFLHCLGTLHLNWIGHGDIHEGNILVDADGNVVIIDYGSASLGENKQTARDILDDLYCMTGLKNIFQTNSLSSQLFELMSETIESYCQLVDSTDPLETFYSNSMRLCQYYVNRLREIF